MGAFGHRQNQAPASLKGFDRLGGCGGGAAGEGGGRLAPGGGARRWRWCVAAAAPVKGLRLWRRGCAKAQASRRFAKSAAPCPRDKAELCPVCTRAAQMSTPAARWRTPRSLGCDYRGGAS
eukprot:5763163-Prymnesium_polylepis.1